MLSCAIFVSSLLVSARPGLLVFDISTAEHPLIQDVGRPQTRSFGTSSMAGLDLAHCRVCTKPARRKSAIRRRFGIEQVFLPWYGPVLVYVASELPDDLLLESQAPNEYDQLLDNGGSVEGHHHDVLDMAATLSALGGTLAERANW
jgi:hypothetical protein